MKTFRFFINLVTLFSLNCAIAATSKISSKQKIAHKLHKEESICEIRDEGASPQGWKKVRLVLSRPAQDESVTGFDSLEEATLLLSEYKNQGVCQTRPEPCDIESDGYAMGSWYRSVLTVHENPISGANDVGTLLSQLNQLRSTGVCE